MRNFNRTQIVMVDLGESPNQIVGHEQANQRPCLIIQTLDFSKLAVVIPFTSKQPNSLIYSIVKIQKNTGGLTLDSFALCHQIRSVSFHRIVGTVGNLPEREFNKVLMVLTDFLGI